MEQQTFTLATSDFDASFLPAGSRAIGTPAFREAVNQFFLDAFQGFGGKASIAVDDKKIVVTWSPDRDAKPIDVVSAKIQRGQQNEAIQLLRLMLSRRPDDLELLYTLGSTLSDTGQLDEAQIHLRRAVEIKPRFVNGLVALGVALSRQQKHSEAIEVLEEAVDLGPENPWACLNLGMTLLKVGQFAKALPHLQTAVVVHPENQGAWLALGEASRLDGSTADAQKAYAKAIELNPHNDIAESSRRGSSKLAQESFDKKAVGAIRMDAVEYCISAIKQFKRMPKSEVQNITFEIAMLGRSGFDVNDPDQKHRLKTMSGEFSSLELICYMHTGFQIIAPGTDIGFDVSKEYATALTML